MNKLFLIKVISPAILCCIIILFTKISIEYYPLLLGLLISVFNYGSQNKYNLIVIVLLSLIMSYITFYISYFSFPLIGNILKTFLSSDKSALIALHVSVSIISPLLVFYGFNLIYKFSKTKKTNYIVLISISCLIINSLTFHYFLNNNLLKIFKKIQLDNYTIWLLIMVFAIQLIIHQEKIWNKNGLNKTQ